MNRIIWLAAVIASNIQPGTCQSAQNLANAFASVRQHQLGQATLSFDQLKALANSITTDTAAMAQDSNLFKSAVEIVAHYELNDGPMFINQRTLPGWPRSLDTQDGKTYDRVIFLIQQAVHNVGISAWSLANWDHLIDGLEFKTSAYFPGEAEPPVNPNQNYTVQVNASLETCWGRPSWQTTDPVRRPTGFYLAPGSIGIVSVPQTMVNNNFYVLVGAHTTSKITKSDLRRFDDVTKMYPITAQETRIANPFGGGIYIIVPYEANSGAVDLTLSNVIPAPFFSSTPYRTTLLADWQNLERQHPGPWADFQSEYFMMQVPTRWIYAYPDPVAMMAQWDLAMGGVSEILGYPGVRNREVLYLQPDVSIKHSVYGIGYPQVNQVYNPTASENGNKDHWMLGNLPLEETEYHELGHESRMTRFSGEIESVVHILYAFVANDKFGIDLDTAFSQSCAGEQGVWSLDNTAVYWMGREVFIQGQDMELLSYEHTGHAKYVEIAKLFGWEPVKFLYQQQHLDFINGNTNLDLDQDASIRILQLSKGAGVDLTPLIHFWGRKPGTAIALEDSINALGLPKSEKIYDRLVYYKSLIPADKAAYSAFINKLYPNGSNSNSDGSWGYNWMLTVEQTYDAAYAEQSAQAVQNIIDTYFPDGRPPAVSTRKRSLSPLRNERLTLASVNTREIQFHTPQPGHYEISFYQSSGKIVARIASYAAAPGMQCQTLRNENLNTGFYIILLRQGSLGERISVILFE